MDEATPRALSEEPHRAAPSVAAGEGGARKAVDRLKWLFARASSTRSGRLPALGCVCEGAPVVRSAGAECRSKQRARLQVDNHRPNSARPAQEATFYSQGHPRLAWSSCKLAN